MILYNVQGTSDEKTTDKGTPWKEALKQYIYEQKMYVPSEFNNDDMVGGHLSDTSGSYNTKYIGLISKDDNNQDSCKSINVEYYAPYLELKKHY